MQTVTPRTYLVGYTTIHEDGMLQYLHDTENAGFYDSLEDARHEQGVPDGLSLCSFMAKLCYKALTIGKNENISRTRDIESNLQACFDHGHGSVYEHCVLNFVTTNCSRTFTHELVRHRAGTAFSQTSGRYVRSDEVDAVLDDPILDMKTEAGSKIRDFLVSCLEATENAYAVLNNNIDWDSMGKDDKKRLTSALRRILPTGQSNEIGWSANIRTLRHLLLMRTAAAAEWEIRTVFDQVYNIMLTQFPQALYGAYTENLEDGTFAVRGMKTQPYE